MPTKKKEGIVSCRMVKEEAVEMCYVIGKEIVLPLIISSSFFLSSKIGKEPNYAAFSF